MKSNDKNKINDISAFSFYIEFISGKVKVYSHTNGMRIQTGTLEDETTKVEILGPDNKYYSIGTISVHEGRGVDKSEVTLSVKASVKFADKFKNKSIRNSRP